MKKAKNKDDKVYISNSELRSIAVIAYFAKWSNPELFDDINPETIYKELLQKF